MKKFVVLFGLSLVLGIQSQLFAPPLLEELSNLQISDDQEQSDSDSESDTEDEGNDQSEVELDTPEVSSLDECLAKVEAKLKDAKKKLAELAHIYQSSSYQLPEGEVVRLLDTLQACVTEYNKFAGTNFDLIEPELD